MEISENSAETNSNELISSAEGIRVSRSARPDNAAAPTMSAIFGLISQGLFAYLDRATCFWKMSQGTFLSDLETFSGTWPDSGTMRNGRVYELQNSAPAICESGSLLWPTTRASSGGGNRSAYREAPYRPALAQKAQNWPTPRREDGESCGNHPGAVDSLTGAAKIWPTPNAHDATGGPRNRQNSVGAGHQTTIAEQAEHWNSSGNGSASAADDPGRLSKTQPECLHLFDVPDAEPETSQTEDCSPTNWQTPGTDSFRSRGGDRKDEMGLDQQARRWDFPSFPDQQIPDGQTFCEQDPISLLLSLQLKRLNPRFEEWLMKFPIGWTEL